MRRVKNYKYYLFDWDGCLAKTLDVWLESYRQVFNKVGLNPSDVEIAHHFGDHQYFENFGLSYKEAKTRDLEVVTIARELLKEVQLYENAYELIAFLKEGGHKLAIVSSSSKDILGTGIRHNGIHGMVDAIVDGDDVKNHKPHPEPLELAMSLVGGLHQSTVMVGDSRKDLEAATNFGVDSVLMYPGRHSVFYGIETLRSYNPTYEFEDFKQFLSALS